MNKTELLEKLLGMFVAKYGYNNEVKIDEVGIECERIPEGTPMIKRIKVNKGEDILMNFQLYIDFWSWGWTDENSYWGEKRVAIIEQYGAQALAQALNVKIKSETTYKIEL